MKVKVVSVFRDKYTNEIYKANQEIEVSKKRYNEIKQYVKAVKSKNK